MQSTIDYLTCKLRQIEWELIYTKMDVNTRLKKVIALDKINDAINTLQSIL